MLLKIEISKQANTIEDYLDAESVAAILVAQCAEGSEIISEECIACYLLHDDKRGAEEAIGSFLPQGWEVQTVQEIPVENWVQNCEQVFESIEIGELIIQPIGSAQAVRKSALSLKLFIIPGLGFGTGHHATTRSVLELFQHPAISSQKPKTALDVGTGSGILAIGLSKLYGTAVDACDIDPDALENARENSELNDVSPLIHFSEGTIEQYTKSYEVVVANIYAEILIEIKQALYERVIPSGYLALSGIMEIKREVILEHFGPLWRRIDERALNGWVSLLFQRIQ